MKLRLLPTVVPLVILALVLTSCFNERDEQGMTVLVIDAPDGVDAAHTQNSLV